MDLRAFGGKLLEASPQFRQSLDSGSAAPSSTSEVWNFGYRLYFQRTKEENFFDTLFNKNEAKPFAITGGWNDDEEIILTSNLAKKANNGKHLLTFYQRTGSCVGNGGGQGVWHLSAVEVIRLGDPEQFLLPFYLMTYGRSRFYGGIRGRGEGSFGSAMAKAMLTDGMFAYNEPGLPQPTQSEEEGTSWGAAAEMQWSDGEAIDQKWIDKGRKHLVQSVARIADGDAAWEAASNYYPMTCASDWGGQMSPPIRGSGDKRVLLNSRVTTWQHQMCCIGRWRHPEFGKLFYILNSWSPRAHGICPSGAQPGGFWITFKEFDYICRSGEVYAISQYQGYPAQTFSWKSAV